MLNIKDLPVRFRRGRSHIVGPIIIAEAVLDDQIGLGGARCDFGADLERMWVGVRIGFGRNDADIGPPI